MARDVNFSVVDVAPNRHAVTQDAIAEAVHQGGQLLVEIVLAEQDFAGEKSSIQRNR